MPQLLETLAGVQVGTETLRTHAEAAGSELEGEPRAAMAQVEATQEPPSGYAPVTNDRTLVVEADGVMARYRDRHLDGTLITGEWHEIKLGRAGGWQDGQLVMPCGPWWSSGMALSGSGSTWRPCLAASASKSSIGITVATI